MSKGHRFGWVSFCAGAVLVLASAPGAKANMINFENFNYTGSVTRYNSAADAQNHVNSTGTYTISTATNGSNSTLPNARDAYIYSDTSTNEFDFGTAWYFTPQEWVSTGTDGYGNPNNTNNGFVQLYDTTGSSLSSLSMGWNSAQTQFTVDASGQNAGSTEYARFWPAPNLGGASSISGGTFLNYALNLTASFSSPATNGAITGVSPDGVTGNFDALFQNTGTDPTYNGFYLISLVFHNGSSADANNYAAIYAGHNDFSQVIADTAFVTPLPPAWILAASGFLILGFFGAAGRQRRIA